MKDFDAYLHLLPMAISWLLAIEADALEHGHSLSELQLKDAQDVGVVSPEKIRILYVDKITDPNHPDLYAAANEIGLLNDRTIGRTVRYGIQIVQGQESRRLLRHEFRHVQQFEAADSFESFVYNYIQSVFTDGYNNSQYEIDARAFEDY